MIERRPVALAAALIILSTPAFAQLKATMAPISDSEWDDFKADPGSTPNSPIGATTPEGGFSAPERVIFSEKMRDRVLDQLCRQLKLQYEYRLPGDFGGTGAGFRRWLAPLPDGRLTIVDEERLSVGYGHAFTQALEQVPGVSGSLWLGGRLEGSSMVIRPLEGKATCKEVDRLIDLRDIKTVLPFKKERIAAMKVGELWRMPFRLTVGHTETLGENITQAADTAFNASLTFNGTESGEATLTIYRLSESELRFRFRVDRVEIRTKGARLAQTIPAADFAIAGGNILLNLIDRELAKQLNRYTSASLGFSNAKTQGKRVVLEYVVDPRKPEEAEAVAQALHGDFKSLVKMGWRMGTQQATSDSTEEAYRDLQSKHDAELGPAKFAAIDAYTQKAKNITLNLPFLTSQNWSKSRGENTTTRYTDEQGEIHFERGDRSHQGEWFTIPWVGPLVKNQDQQDVQAVSAARTGEAHGDPILIYLQQHGFLRATESSVRDKAKQFQEIMALAGTHGNGPNPRMALPIDKVMPPPPPAQSCFENCPVEPSNRKGTVAFTLVFTQKAVDQLIHATPEDVIRSYAATVDSMPAMQWLMNNGKLNEHTGKIDYDWRAARKAFPDPFDDRAAGSRSWEEGEISRMAKEAAGLIADLAKARDASDNVARSAALVTAFNGKGESKMVYDRALRVFVQLVDPMNLTADFVANVDRPKKETDVRAHYVLKRNRPENELLKLAGEAKARVANPSILVD
ncbi:MAG: hypothetical protein HY923_11325 [Elusimicrobia bacterium]|nr:hypothetical protein [Elusimicrobiota bacterium]